MIMIIAWVFCLLQYDQYNAFGECWNCTQTSKIKWKLYVFHNFHVHDLDKLGRFICSFHSICWNNTSILGSIAWVLWRLCLCSYNLLCKYFLFDIIEFKYMCTYNFKILSFFFKDLLNYVFLLYSYLVSCGYASANQSHLEGNGY